MKEIHPTATAWAVISWVIASFSAALVWFSASVNLDPGVFLPVVSVGVGALCLVGALARYDLFLLILIALRPTLDGLSQGTQVSGAGMTSPSVMVGLAFVGASTLWLLGRRARGMLVPPTPVTWSWVALVTAAGLSCLVSDYPVVALAATFRLAAAALMFAVLEQALLTGLLTVERLLRAMATAGVIVLAWVGLQVLTRTGAEDPWTGLTRVTGPFVHPSVLAKFLVVLGLTLLSLAVADGRTTRQRWITAASLLATLAALGLTYTRGAWLAFVIGAAFVIWRWRPAFVPLFGMVGAIAVVSIPSIYARVADLWSAKPPAPGVPDTSVAWRLGYWQHLLPLARVSPVNGRGLDSISLIGGQGLAAHNIWVQSVVEMGLVGVLCLIGVVVALFASLRTHLRQNARSPLVIAATAIGIAMLFMSFSENLLNETTTLWYTACVIVAATAGADRPQSPHDTEGDRP